MYYARRGIKPPNEWYHRPTITSDCGNTVADYLKYRSRNIPPEWNNE